MMFDTGEIQEIEDILIHKEQRANLQSNLLSKYSNSSLMVFTLNIPGPIKNNPMIEQVFRQGQQSIQQMFLKKKVEMTYTKEINLPSGLDWYVIVTEAPLNLKKWLVTLEEQDALGRLFDLDVLFQKGEQITIVSRQALNHGERPCFICGKSAKVCARNRTHTVKEMQKKIEQIVADSLKGALKHA